MIDLPTTHMPDCIPGFPGVSFGLSCEGFPVARVGDHAFAMLPGHAGRHYLATGWKIGRPFPEWRRGDFYGHSRELTDEAAFSAHVLEQAEHQREKQVLGRRNIATHVHTPWGSSQHSTTYAEGVEFHSSASHGGFRLSADRNRTVHPLLRADDGFYEEDCAWAAVALTFPELFTSFEKRCASETLKDWEPDEWEAIFATVLTPGESHVKDRRAFELEHAGDWIVISALRSDHHPGMTEVIATRGGRRDHGGAERRFLVPSPEYEAGRFGFIIDEARHAAYDGPSSFVSWTGEDVGMNRSIDRQAELRRMEEACRQTRHQLDMIDRQIIRRMTALIPSLGRRKHGYRRGRPLEPDAFLTRYRSNLAAITAQRQPEIDALTRKLMRQQSAIAALQEAIP